MHMKTRKIWKSACIGTLIVTICCGALPPSLWQRTAHAQEEAPPGAFVGENGQCFPVEAATSAARGSASGTTPPAAGANAQPAPILNAKRTYTISAFSRLASVYVPFGTSVQEVQSKLPGQLVANLRSRGTTSKASLPVQWDANKAAYNPNVPGTYVLRGLIPQLPSNVKNNTTAPVRPTITIHVSNAELADPVRLENMVVPFNTPFEALELPNALNVAIVSAGETKQVRIEIDWSESKANGAYKSDIVGTHNVYGKFKNTAVISPNPGIKDVVMPVVVQDKEKLDGFIQLFKQIFDYELNQKNDVSKNILNYYLRWNYALSDYERLLTIQYWQRHYLGSFDQQNTPWNVSTNDRNFFTSDMSIANIKNELSKSNMRTLLVRNIVNFYLDDRRNFGPQADDLTKKQWIDRAMQAEMSVAELMLRMDIRNAIWLRDVREATDADYKEWLEKAKPNLLLQPDVQMMILGSKAVAIINIFDTMYSRPITRAALDYWLGVTSNDIRTMKDRMYETNQYKIERENPEIRLNALRTLFTHYFGGFREEPFSINELDRWNATKKTIKEIEADIKRGCGWESLMRIQFGLEGLTPTKAQLELDMWSFMIELIVRKSLKHDTEKIKSYIEAMRKTAYSYQEMDRAMLYRNFFALQNDKEPTKQQLDDAVRSTKNVDELLLEVVSRDTLRIVTMFQEVFFRFPTSQEVNEWKPMIGQGASDTMLFRAMYAQDEARETETNKLFWEKNIKRLITMFLGIPQNETQRRVADVFLREYIDINKWNTIENVYKSMREQVKNVYGELSSFFPATFHIALQERVIENTFKRKATDAERMMDAHRAEIYTKIWDYELKDGTRRGSTEPAEDRANRVNKEVDAAIKARWTSYYLDTRLWLQRVHMAEKGTPISKSDLDKLVDENIELIKNFNGDPSQLYDMKKNEQAEKLMGAKRYNVFQRFYFMFQYFPKKSEIDSWMKNGSDAFDPRAFFQTLYQSEAYKKARVLPESRPSAIHMMMEYYWGSVDTAQQIAYLRSNKSIDDIEREIQSNDNNRFFPTMTGQKISLDEFLNNVPNHIVPQEDKNYLLKTKKYGAPEIQRWVQIAQVLYSFESALPTPQQITPPPIQRERVQALFDQAGTLLDIYVTSAVKAIHRAHTNSEISEQQLRQYANTKDFVTNPEQDRGWAQTIAGERRGQIMDMYKNFFGAYPTHAKLNELDQSKDQLKEMIDKLYRSNEYVTARERAGYREQAIVNAYQHFLGRIPSPQEQEYKGSLSELDRDLRLSGERQKMIRNVIESNPDLMELQDDGRKVCYYGADNMPNEGAEAGYSTRCYSPELMLLDHPIYSTYSINTVFPKAIGKWGTDFNEQTRREEIHRAGFFGTDAWKWIATALVVATAVFLPGSFTLLGTNFSYASLVAAAVGFQPGSCAGAISTVNYVNYALCAYQVFFGGGVQVSTRPPLFTNPIGFAIERLAIPIVNKLLQQTIKLTENISLQFGPTIGLGPDGLAIGGNLLCGNIGVGQHTGSACLTYNSNTNKVGYALEYNFDSNKNTNKIHGSYGAVLGYANSFAGGDDKIEVCANGTISWDSQAYKLKSCAERSEDRISSVMFDVERVSLRMATTESNNKIYFPSEGIGVNVKWNTISNAINATLTYSNYDRNEQHNLRAEFDKDGVDFGYDVNKGLNYQNCKNKELNQRLKNLETNENYQKLNEKDKEAKRKSLNNYVTKNCQINLLGNLSFYDNADIADIIDKIKLTEKEEEDVTNTCNKEKEELEKRGKGGEYKDDVCKKEQRKINQWDKANRERGEAHWNSLVGNRSGEEAIQYLDKTLFGVSFNVTCQSKRKKIAPNTYESVFGCGFRAFNSSPVNFEFDRSIQEPKPSEPAGFNLLDVKATEFGTVIVSFDQPVSTRSKDAFKFTYTSNGVPIYRFGTIVEVSEDNKTFTILYTAKKGANYTLEVRDVRNMEGVALDAAKSSKVFAGVDQAPLKLVRTIAMNDGTIKIEFNQFLSINPNNPPSIIVSYTDGTVFKQQYAKALTVEGRKTIIADFATMPNVEYTITVNNVQAVNGMGIGAGDPKVTFYGVGKNK